jgi:hypothetical protein
MSNSQRAAVARRERPKPQYIARAKVGNGWVSIGACWPLRSGEEGFSLKLTTIPIGNWDGRFVLLPPLDTDNVGDDPPEDPEPQFRGRRGEPEGP